MYGHHVYPVPQPGDRKRVLNPLGLELLRVVSQSSPHTADLGFYSWQLVAMAASSYEACLQVWVLGMKPSPLQNSICS